MEYRDRVYRPAICNDVAPCLHADCNNHVGEIACEFVGEDPTVGVSHCVHAPRVDGNCRTQFGNEIANECDIIHRLGCGRTATVSAVPSLVSSAIGLIPDSIGIDGNETVRLSKVVEARVYGELRRGTEAPVQRNHKRECSSCR